MNKGYITPDTAFFKYGLQIYDLPKIYKPNLFLDKLY